MSEELKALAPAQDLSESVTVTSIQRRAADGAEISTADTHVIRPFTYRQLWRVLPHFDKIFDALGTTNEINFSDTLGLIRLIMKVSAGSGDSIQALTAIAINRDVSYFDTLQSDDGLKLTIAVARVNKDFFVQKILPLVTMIKTEAAEATPEAAQASGQA